MDDFFLFAVSLGITVLGLLGSWAAYRRRGAASGTRGAAWSLVPMALYLTGLTEWFTDLVFSPVKWAGVGVLGLALVLYVASGVGLRRREGDQAKVSKGEGGGDRTDTGRSVPDAQGAEKKQVGQRKNSGKNSGATADPEMADIEKILRDRGIS